jgi:hypothetical protein
VVLNPETFGVSPIPIVEDMVGEYICGNASILTEPGIGTGQTPVSTEHEDGTVSGLVFAGGVRHPAVRRSVVTRSTMVKIMTGRGGCFSFFSDIGYLP